MPKLPKKTQEAAAEAESGGFSALPEGKYLCVLEDVQTDGEGPKGPYWTWVWKVHPDNGSHDGRMLWDVISLSESAAWKVKQVFDALGFSLDSDTDELIGEMAVLAVTQRVIAKGKREGEMGNQVDLYLPADGGGADDGGDDVF
jgi:hypothetical protein